MKPKSPQSSPVKPPLIVRRRRAKHAQIKRAKRARLMHRTDNPRYADLMLTSNIRAGGDYSPLHVLDASEDAHEQRVNEGARALYRYNRPGAYSKGQTWAKLTEPEQQYYKNMAATCLASVYSAPAGKGRNAK